MIIDVAELFVISGETTDIEFSISEIPDILSEPPDMAGETSDKFSELFDNNVLLVY